MEISSPLLNPVSCEASIHNCKSLIPLGPSGADGEADELGESEGDGLLLIDADADDDGDTELLGLTLADGLIDALGDGLLDTEGDGLTDADGDGEGEPIAAITISVHTFTPFVASRSENVCTQN